MAETYLHDLCHKADIGDGAPLQAESWQAGDTARLAQRVHCSVCVPVVGLACTHMQTTSVSRHWATFPNLQLFVDCAGCKNPEGVLSAAEPAEPANVNCAGEQCNAQIGDLQ